MIIRNGTSFRSPKLFPVQLLTMEPEWLHSTEITSDAMVLKNPVDSTEESTFESQIDRPKASGCRIRKMYFAAFNCLLMATAMGLAAGYTAPATYDMKRSFLKPTKSDISWIGSILALGAMLGGLIGGPLADRLGRQLTLVLNVVTFLAGWLPISLAENVSTIVIGRFITGIACGIVSVAVPMYCVEISTPEVRGLLGTLFQGFMVIGQLLSSIIGSYVSWVNLALVGAGTATFGLLCYVTMPESPKWLVAQNETVKAQTVIQNLQGDYVDAKKECDRIYEEIKSQPKGSLKLKECYNPAVFKPALITVAMMFFQQFSGANAVMFYSSTIFEAKESKDFINPKYATIILCCIQVVATISSSIAVDKSGRKLLLLLSGAFMSLSHVFLGFYYYESTKNAAFQHKMEWVPLASLCVFIIAFSIGYGPIPWLLSAEMVPLRARSTIGGLATFANGLFAFIVTKTFNQLEDFVTTYGAFWTYSVVSFLSCIFVIFILPETKGKELDEISDFFCTPKTGTSKLSISTIA